MVIFSTLTRQTLDKWNVPSGIYMFLFCFRASATAFSKAGKSSFPSSGIAPYPLSVTSIKLPFLLGTKGSGICSVSIKSTPYFNPPAPVERICILCPGCNSFFNLK